MEENEKILPSKILKYNSILEEDLKLTEMNIKEQALKCSNYKTKWLKIYFIECSILSTLEDTKNECIEKYTSYNDNVPKFKADIEANKQQQVLELDKKIKIQKEVVRYLEKAIQIVGAFGYDISTSKELIKLETI